MAQREAAFTAAVERRHAEQARRQDEGFQAMYSEVLQGLGGGGGTIVGEAQHALDHSARARAKKQRALHEEWTTQVFDKVQGRLQVRAR